MTLLWALSSILKTLLSTSNVPFWAFNKPRIISTVVVLPLPVMPTKPEVVHDGIIKLISFTVSFVEFGYL